MGIGRQIVISLLYTEDVYKFVAVRGVTVDRPAERLYPPLPNHLYQTYWQQK